MSTNSVDSTDGENTMVEGALQGFERSGERRRCESVLKRLITLFIGSGYEDLISLPTLPVIIVVVGEL